MVTLKPDEKLEVNYDPTWGEFINQNRDCKAILEDTQRHQEKIFIAQLKGEDMKKYSRLQKQVDFNIGLLFKYWMLKRKIVCRITKK